MSQSRQLAAIMFTDIVGYTAIMGHDEQKAFTILNKNQQRIETHISGGNKSTAPRRPLKLIFCEFYLFENDARKRELYFKTSMGKKAIKLMLASTLQKLGYKKNGKLTIQIIFEDQTDYMKATC